LGLDQGGHDRFANIDVAVVGAPAKAVTASSQFFVEERIQMACVPLRKGDHVAHQSLLSGPTSRPGELHGVDLPEASCLIDARPTFSKARYIQTGGRIQRLSSGKVDALYFDHAGNANRHGRLEDFAVKELLPERKPGGVCAFSGKALKYCDACDAEVGTATLRCPNCGEPLDDGVIRKPGELVEDDVRSLLADAAAAGVIPRIAKDGTPVVRGPNRAAVEPWLPKFKANRSEILKIIQPDMFEVTV
jgi:hypothetical protein